MSETRGGAAAGARFFDLFRQRRALPVVQHARVCIDSGYQLRVCHYAAPAQAPSSPNLTRKRHKHPSIYCSVGYELRVNMHAFIDRARLVCIEGEREGARGCCVWKF